MKQRRDMATLESSIRGRMSSQSHTWQLLCGALGACLLFATTTPAKAAPNLVPMPKSMIVEEGTMPLTAASKIFAGDASLMPLATVLSDEIQLVTGLKLKVEQGRAGRGDIGLKINSALRADTDILAVQKQKIGVTRDFAHTIAIGDSAVVEGWDYRAVAEGTATILQAITGKGGQYSLPKMKIKDWPHADYTGVMVDVARQRIPIDSLKAIVEACRIWKIRYCQLHLTDNEAFTFPSAAFPKLGTKNEAMHEGAVPQVYALKDLKELVAFADARGVTLVPELATPGHSKAMARAMPEVFGGPKVMDMTNDEMYKSLDTLVAEMCDVFKSSPYFHIGGEDTYLFEFVELQKTKDYIQKNGMKGVEDILVQHAMRMNTIVRKHGKMTLAWENTASGTEGRQWTLPVPAKDEIVLMCWIPYPTADGYQKQGFTTITVPWNLGKATEWNQYACNGVALTPTNKVLGEAQTMWHMSASALVGDHLGGDLNGSSTEGYIRSLCERMDRAWEPLRKNEEAEYAARLNATRTLLDQLVLPVRIEGTSLAYLSWPVLGRRYCGGAAEVKLSLTNAIGSGEIRYTVDGTEPTALSPVYAAPFTLERTTAVNAALFRAGKQVGNVSRAVFDMMDTGGMINKWLVSGPYSEQGKNYAALFDVVFPPETGGGEWKPAPSPHVKFAEIPGMAGDERVAYLKTQIFSPAAQKATLLVATDDGFKVFLNGKLVHGANVGRALGSPDSVDVTLAEGWNKIMLKVTNANGGWEAWVKVRDAAGEVMDKMRVKAE
jgi:hexosaminidase